MSDPLEDTLVIGRNPDSMPTFLVLYIYADLPQYLLVHLMDGLLQLSVILSVQPPTKIKSFFHPCRKEKFASVPIFDMVRMMLHSGHSPGSHSIVT